MLRVWLAGEDSKPFPEFCHMPEAVYSAICLRQYIYTTTSHSVYLKETMVYIWEDNFANSQTKMTRLSTQSFTRSVQYCTCKCKDALITALIN